MGNQLAISGAAASIQLSDVSTSMTLMAPLGVGRRGRLFTSMHCGVLSPDWDPNTATTSSQQTAASSAAAQSSGGGSGGGGGQHPQRRRIRQEYVVKVFLRNADDKLQAQLIAQHHEMLLSIEKRLRVPPPVPRLRSGGTPPPTSDRSGEDSTTTTASPPVHLLFYNEMDRRNERFCKLQRPFVQYSITERLQMRPQCTQDQRLFFAFQLLEALDQLHTHYGLVHGDLKVENVLVTSHNWLHLVDFAPFKPSMLPSYNPANFEFYYDASETRVCCAAPEKFFDFATAVKPAVTAQGDGGAVVPPTASPTSSMPPPASPVNKSGAHTSSMDVFSAACVIAQIMTDEPLFRLSGVLELRSKISYAEKEAYVRKLLQEKGVVSEALMRFLISPLCSAPEKRPTARDLLNDTTVFPQYFGFLHDRVFPNVLRAPPDAQAFMMHSQWGRMMQTIEALSAHAQLVVVAPTTGTIHIDPSSSLLGPADSMSSPLPPAQQHLQRQISDEALLTRGAGSLLFDEQHQLHQQRVICERQKKRARRTAVTLLLPLIVSSIRHLKSIEARCQVIDILRLCIVSDATPASIRDVMLPYLVHMIRRPVYPVGAALNATGDSSSAGIAGGSTVRAHAIHVLRVALDESTAQQLFQSSEALLFDDYIFPVLSEAARDTSVLVQCALATHAPHLLSTATKFLEWRQTFYCGSATTSTSNTSSTAGASCLTYDAQLHAIHVYGWDLLKSLYKQRHPAVAIAILRETSPAVVDFLGEERAQDDLLPLLTTMVSSTLEIRREAIVCALRLQALLDAPRPKMLRFFAEEGLRQTDSGCLLGTIGALQHLVETRCKMEPVELLNVVLAVIPQMANPSHWVRVAACHLVEACARTYRPADIMLHLECAVRPFLNHAVPLSMLSQFPNAVKSELAWVHTDHSVPLSATGASAAAQQQDHQQHHQYEGSQITIPTSVTTHTTADLMMDDHHVDVPHTKIAATPKSTTSATEPAVVSAKESTNNASAADAALDNSDTRVDLPVDALCTTTTELTVGCEQPRDWNLVFAPSTRHARRYSHQSEWERSCGSALQQALVQRRAAAQGGVPGGTTAAGGTLQANSTQAHRARSSMTGSRPTTGTSALSSAAAAASPTGSASTVQPMRPTAAPLFASPADPGSNSILAMDSIGGLLVSAGSRGCVKMWEISSDDYVPSSNVVPSMLHLVPSNETTLAAAFLSTSAATNSSAGLLLGGTQGIVRYCEVEADRVISEAPIGRTQSATGGGGVISSVSKLMHHSLALVSTGDGVVAVLDLRTKEMLAWQTIVDASRGPLVATVAIGPTDALGVPTSFQHAAVAATIRGHVMLFDLRHRIEVVHHTIRRQSAGTGLPTTTDASAQAPVQILSIANDVLPAANATTGGSAQSQQPHRNLAFGSHSIFVGTKGAGLFKLDLTTGNIIQTFTTAMPTDIRTILPAPRSPWVITGSADRLVRVWNSTSPSSSYTLCSTASESPKVIVSSGVAEEGVAPAHGFGPWQADVSSAVASSQYRQHHCDQVTVVHALRLRTAHYLVSGSRNGQLTVWHNAGQ